MRWTVHLDGGPRRVNHAAVGVGDVIYSFGGYCTGEDYRINESIDVHVLNINTLRWSLIPPRKDSKGELLKYPEVPFHRYGHTAVAYNEKIYLWGGRDDDNLCNTLYCFDPKTLTWSRPAVKGAIPGARDGHSACVVNNCMYIFGGFVDEIYEFSCDVHCLNFDTMEWRYIQTYGLPPSFRDFHSAVALNDRMYIFGGRGDKNSPHHSEEEMYCPEIIYLDLNTKMWHRPSTTGKVPVGRRSHSMFVHNDLIYVFGGYNGILDKHFNDLYTFDPKSNCWNLVKPHGKPPTARRRQVCIVKGTRMYLFGGTSSVERESSVPEFLIEGRQYFESNLLFAFVLNIICFLLNLLGTLICSPFQRLPEQYYSYLIDNNDTHVLDFEPSLKTLSILRVVELRMDVSWMPRELRTEIRTMTLPNAISRAINHAG